MVLINFREVWRSGFSGVVGGGGLGRDEEGGGESISISSFGLWGCGGGCESISISDCSSSSSIGSVLFVVEEENLIAVLRNRDVISSLNSNISWVGPNKDSRDGFVVHIASPFVFMPFSFSASELAVAKARLILDVKRSGMGFLGRGVAAPEENEDSQPSLSPGTNMKVEEWRRVGYSDKVRARESKYSLYSILPPLPPRAITACCTKLPIRMNVIGVSFSGSEA